jgi:hypothetical protein
LEERVCALKKSAIGPLNPLGPTIGRIDCGQQVLFQDRQQGHPCSSESKETERHRGYRSEVDSSVVVAVHALLDGALDVLSKG